jgi:hypothetical protein
MIKTHSVKIREQTDGKNPAEPAEAVGSAAYSALEVEGGPRREEEVRLGKLDVGAGRVELGMPGRRGAAGP